MLQVVDDQRHAKQRTHKRIGGHSRALNKEMKQDRDVADRREGVYLRKQAASEEVGQPANLTGDSCTDLRRDGRMGAQDEKKRQ